MPIDKIKFTVRSRRVPSFLPRVFIFAKRIADGW